MSDLWYLADYGEHGHGNIGAGGGSNDERRLVGCNALVTEVSVVWVENTFQRFQSSSSPPVVSLCLLEFHS